jgi:peptide/nickel transport system substrate-binding protein
MEEMKVTQKTKAPLWACLAAALSVGAGPALAAKSGGTLKVYHRGTPPSGSIHEEATNSTVMPYMSVFNNLIMFDQHKPRNSAKTIVPDLATSWSWNDDMTKLTFKLREGVKFHDGKPFTAKDVACTWDLILGTSQQKLRKNPRKSWYTNLDSVSVNGDYEATFNLKRPQPAFPMLLASGYSPVYPCHVSPKDMRTNPIGTGPFKFVALKQNESIKFVKNEDYWKEGRPYLDAIDYTIIKSRSTRILGFIAGEFDMTFDTDVTIPLMRDIAAKNPSAVCKLVPTAVTRNLIVNGDSPPFDNPDLRKALALSMDRNAFNEILQEGTGDIGGAMLPPPEGLWGLSKEQLKDVTGYGDVQKNREEARAIMTKLGYGPDKRMKLKVSTRNIAIYRDPAVILIDHLKEIYIDAELENVETSNWHAKVARKDYSVGLNLTGSGVDDPDAHFYENYACGSERNYTGYCNQEIMKLMELQSMETDVAKRREIVWEIDKRLQEDGARPILYHARSAQCHQAKVKGFEMMENSVYNGFRMEDVWLDQ